MTSEGSKADTLPGGSRLGAVVAGKYRLLRLLGRGGMGEVYEARHEVVGRRFAVKFLHAEAARGHDAARRFVREARAAGALDSPHIAAVLDFDTEPDGSPFLVMEYLTGESLATLLAREGSLPLRRALALLLQVCDGLEVAHRAGIVHRDLKPDNLMVTKQKDGTDLLKILDFGIAKLVDTDANGDVTRSGAVLGTPFYMAPEQARGEKSVDHRVDIYALGVLAYELFSGQKPHPGDGYNSILAHILTQPVAALGHLCPELPPALVTVVERALSFEPARRQTSAAELASELAPFAGRALVISDSHFDLSEATGRSESLPTHGASEQSSGGTLESAIGEVQSTRADHRPWRSAPVAILAVASVATVFVFLQARERVAREEREHAVSTARSAKAEASEMSAATSSAMPGPLTEPEMSLDAIRPGGSVPPPAAPRPSSSAAKPRVRAAAPSRRPPLGDETTFDETNPY